MWGDVLCRESGGLRPPEAEAILDFYMHNFDQILNYFCFARATVYRNTAFHLEYKQQQMSSLYNNTSFQYVSVLLTFN